jgi:hypothetical protein
MYRREHKSSLQSSKSDMLIQLMIKTKVDFFDMLFDHSKWLYAHSFFRKNRANKPNLGLYL